MHATLAGDVAVPSETWFRLAPIAEEDLKAMLLTSCESKRAREDDDECARARKREAGATRDRGTAWVGRLLGACVIPAVHT